MQFEPQVKILADSLSNDGIRLTTFELRYWRAIHSELMTHRKFSRCAQSSRATPINIAVKNAMENPWGPSQWTQNCKGMVAEENIPDNLQDVCQLAWETAAKTAASIAQSLQKLNVHKQIVNRLLEPFSPISVVVSATEWNNFWSLRRAPDADPSIQLLANKMYEAYQTSTPKVLSAFEWHMPYIRNEDYDLMKDYLVSSGIEDDPAINSVITDQLIRVSAARCARVSVKPFTGDNVDIQADLALYEKLVINKHFSPLEHVAFPDEAQTIDWRTKGLRPNWKHAQHHGNFIGWCQLRKLWKNEYVPG